MGFVALRGEERALLVVDQILDLLRNGEWLGLKDLVVSSGLRERSVGLVVDFLCSFGFLECDKKVGRVRLSKDLLVFLRRVENLERGDGRQGRGGGVKRTILRGTLGF